MATTSIVVAAALAGCGGHGSVAHGVHFVVSPPKSLLYDPVSVSIDGLPAGAAVTVQARALDSQGKQWTSSARYTATAAGAVSLGQASSGGSYTGADAMGLLQFMTPAAGNTASLFLSPDSGFTMDLTAVVNGKDVASTTVIRQGTTSVGVTEKDYRPAAGGLYADLFLPKASTTDTARLHPAVLAFGGSEGGLETSASVSSQLAAHGYPTLDLAYFAEPGLPAHLANIPLEYFVKALALLRSEPGVDPKHVLVMGVSRGGEAALLLGATYPKLIDGVIAGVPSAYVFGEPGSVDTPAWTRHGRPLPYLSLAQSQEVYRGLQLDVPKAEIAVERIRGPILLTCGGADHIWPSCTFTASVVARLKAHHFAYPVTSLRYPKAGHYGGDFFGYHPITVQYLTSTTDGFTGGTVNATELAWADNTRHLFALLAAQP